MNTPVMTISELAAYFRVNRSTLYRIIKRGDLPYFKIGSDYRFNRESIVQWMKERTAK